MLGLHALHSATSVSQGGPFSPLDGSSFSLHPFLGVKYMLSPEFPKVPASTSVK